MSSKSALSAANIDNAAISETFDLADISVYSDLSPLVSYINNNYLTRTLNNLVYFSSVNDYGKLNQGAKILATLLDIINFILHEAQITSEESTQARAKLAFLDSRDKIVDFYKSLLGNLKTVYKILALRRPVAVVATLRMLVALVSYKHHGLLSEFFEVFEFSHLAVAKLGIPTKDDFQRKIIVETSMRANFITFFLTVAAAAKAPMRKTLMTNFSITNNIWKYLEMDRFEALAAIFQFLDTHVLSEGLFRRVSKCQMLNESFLFKTSTLFWYVKADNDREGDQEEEDFENFKKSFTEFMDALVTDPAKGITFPQNESGSPLEINNRTHMVNNKLLFTLVTALKPWDSYGQLQFVLKLLNHNSELVPPYMDWMVASAGGYHDPLLSAFWVGHTLVYSEILKSPSLPVKPDYISLLPLSPTALGACLSFNSDLVKQLTLQLVLLELNKVQSAGAPPQLLVESVLSNLPPHAAYIPLLTHANNIIRLTATVIVCKYEMLAPASASAAVVAVVRDNLAAINIESCSALELVLVDNYLAIQSNNDFRWWSRSATGHSFFVSLLKLSHIALLRPKILAILAKLIDTSMVFNTHLLIDTPLVAIIDTVATMATLPSADKLWSCLDETISRCIRTPYKYLDSSHLDYDDLSVFFVALVEQIKFVPDVESDKDILQWLSALLSKAIVLGEPCGAVHRLAEKSDLPLSVSDDVHPRDNLTDKYGFLEQLIDFNNAVAQSANDGVLFEKFTKLGNFLTSSGLSDLMLFNFVTDPGRWFFSSFLGKRPPTKSEGLALALFSELLRQLHCSFAHTKLNEYILTICSGELDSQSQKLVAKLLWILDDPQLVQLASGFHNRLLVVEVHRTILERKIDFVPDFAGLMAVGSDEAAAVLAQFPVPKTHIADVLANPHFHFLLENENAELADYVINHPEVTDDILYRVGGFSPEIARKFSHRVVPLAMLFRTWRWSARIFAAAPELFDVDAVLDHALAVFNADTKAAFSAEFAKLMTTIYSQKANLPNHENSVVTWLHKGMLFITKRLADPKKEVSSGFRHFLCEMSATLDTMAIIWARVPGSIVELQLEVILSNETWIGDVELLEYCVKIIHGKTSIAASRLLHIALNNNGLILKKVPNGENSTLRVASAEIIRGLFRLCSPKESSQGLMLQIVPLYQGSTRHEDILLKDVLQQLESHVSQSWMTHVTGWDFSDMLSLRDLELVGEEPLVISKNSSMVVALKKRFILNTINGGIETAESTRYEDTRYDPEFLMLAMLNNDELVSVRDGTVNFNSGQLVDSAMLQFVVNALSNPAARDIAIVVLHSLLKVLKNPDTSYKEKSIMLVYVSSILHTVRVADHSIPVVWHFVAALVPIINNHAHFLYDRAVHFVLATPVFKQGNIPLFYAISACTNDDDLFHLDNYYRQVAWLVDHLNSGVKSPQDLPVLQLRGVVEWALNLANVQYVSDHLRAKLLCLLYKIEALGYAGSDMLVTKFAALSSLDVCKRHVSPDSVLLVNIAQIAVRAGITGQTKRVVDWSSGDVKSVVKRLRC